MNQEARTTPSPVSILGEALVDFFPEIPGLPLREVDRFTRAVGGAPANVCVGLARLGTKPRLLTVLGDDEFGHYLHQALHREGVDVSAVQFTREAHTGLTFVSLAANGERSFMFMRNSSAEWEITPDKFEGVSFEGCSVLHSGSNLLPRPEGRRATLQLLAQARRQSLLTTMDANLRLHHWDDPQDAVGAVFEALSLVDLLKVSEEEMVFFLEGDDDPVAFKALLRPTGVRWLLVTLGEKGARLLGPEGFDLFVDAPVVEVRDTTGAGDGFCAGLIHALLQRANDSIETPVGRIEALTVDDWRWAIEVATHVGSQVCTRYGATTALPRAAEIPWNDFSLSEENPLL